MNLTSHSNTFGTDPIPVSWGHPDPLVRGPVVCTVRHSSQRNAIGAHQGSYCIYTGLAVSHIKEEPSWLFFILPRFADFFSFVWITTYLQHPYLLPLGCGRSARSRLRAEVETFFSR